MHSLPNLLLFKASLKNKRIILHNHGIWKCSFLLSCISWMVIVDMSALYTMILHVEFLGWSQGACRFFQLNVKQGNAVLSAWPCPQSGDDIGRYLLIGGTRRVSSFLAWCWDGLHHSGVPNRQIPNFGITTIHIILWFFSLYLNAF